MYIDIVNLYIKSLGFTDIMSDSKEKTPTVSPDQGTDSETATLVQLAEVDETPKNSKTTDRDGKLRWRRALIVEFDKMVAEARVNNDNEERKDKND